MKLQSSSISFIESLYEVLRPLLSPTPIYKVHTDHSYVEVTYLDGRSDFQFDNNLEITIFDVLVASLFLEDINILFEGITGVGKSYVTELFFQAIFGNQGLIIDRANYNPYIESSILTHFMETKLVNNIPKQFLNKDKIIRTGAIFVEEVNRREINDLITLLDKKIILNEESAFLGLSTKNSDIIKKIIIISSQNPQDGQHLTIKENDIAEDNRFLKIPFPNSAGSTGSSQLANINNGSLYDAFWQTYLKKQNSKLDREDIFIKVTYAKELKIQLTFEILEYLDLILAYIITNPKEEVDWNNHLIKQIDENISITLREGDFLDKVLNVQSSQKYPLVRRDINKIINYSKLIAFITAIKTKTYEPIITLTDLIASIGILLEGRKVPLSKISIFDFMNDSLQAYQQLKAKTKVTDNAGIRRLIFSKAITNYSENEKNFDIFLKTLRDLVERLRNNLDTRPAILVFSSKIIADVLIFYKYCQIYEADIKKCLDQPNPAIAIQDFYVSNLNNYPSIYFHRLQWLVNEMIV